jgi:hypothetical protein
MKKYYEHELKKDRLALEMALVGFESAIEGAQEAVIKPDTIENKMRAVEELKFAIETIDDLYRSVKYSEERLASYISENAPALTDAEKADEARKESVDALIREEATA